MTVPAQLPYNSPFPLPHSPNPLTNLTQPDLNTTHQTPKMKIPTTPSILLTTVLLPSVLARATTHTILVGQSGLTFTPNTTYASINDKVQFIFYPQNHNVVQGPYSTPCLSGDDTGFYSGFVPSGSGAAVCTLSSIPCFCT